MKEKETNISDLFQQELKKMQSKEKNKIARYKKIEQKKEAKRLKKLEKEEDKAFAKLYNNQQSILTTTKTIQIIYQISIFGLLLLSFLYFIISFFQNKITKFNNILFFLSVIGFLLTSTIQKKNARKITSIGTCILLILWILLHI